MSVVCSIGSAKRSDRIFKCGAMVDRVRARARSAAVGHDSQFQLFFPEFSKSHKNGGKERERESNACGRPRPVDQGKKEMENHSNGPVTLIPDLVMQLLHFNDTQNRQF